MDKPDIYTEELTGLKFFTAFGRDDYEEALRLIKSASFDTSTDIQSLKAKYFVNSGEWDTKDKIQIRLINGSH